MTNINTVVQALDAVKSKISEAAVKAGRRLSDVELVAVTKTHSADTIMPILEAGHRAFGENRVQEALQKWPSLKQQYSNLELHLIGPLQTNKVKDAVGLFDVIQTVDRPKLARVLANEMTTRDKHLKLFIQINTGAEPQKAGVLPDQADEFIKTCQRDFELRIVGLMCIPPFNEEALPHFRLLKEMAERNGVSGLSMGMSNDYEKAVAAGASLVRVGSAIFGARS
jgi:PLP dependent protein